jgi:hypothetical protein
MVIAAKNGGMLPDDLLHSTNDWRAGIVQQGDFELLHIGSSIQMYGLDVSIFLPGPHRRKIL